MIHDGHCRHREQTSHHARSTWQALISNPSFRLPLLSPLLQLCHMPPHNPSCRSPPSCCIVFVFVFVFRHPFIVPCSPPSLSPLPSPLPSLKNNLTARRHEISLCHSSFAPRSPSSFFHPYARRKKKNCKLTSMR